MRVFHFITSYDYTYNYTVVLENPHSSVAGLARTFPVRQSYLFWNRSGTHGQTSKSSFRRTYAPFNPLGIGQLAFPKFGPR